MDKRTLEQTEMIKELRNNEPASKRPRLIWTLLENVLKTAAKSSSGIYIWKLGILFPLPLPRP
jgi:hypothetical protein